MAIPDFQSVMLPLLRFSADEKEHQSSEAVASLADEFELSEEERNELLPSGRQQIFHNRVAWAGTYFRKAGLFERTGRGRFRITARGLQLLKENLDRVDVKTLKRFPEFLQFHVGPKLGVSGEKQTTPVSEEALDPEETLESSYQSVRRALAGELLERIAKCSPTFFERLVVDLLVAMGYGGSRKDAGQAIGRSGDEGIDGIIKEDKLGLDAIYIQAKRWEGTVGRPVVQAFVGSLEGQRARKGVLITTSQFSQEAMSYVAHIDKKVVLINGEELSYLMIDNGIGVTEATVYKVNKIDAEYFEEV